MCQNMPKSAKKRHVESTQPSFHERVSHFNPPSRKTTYRLRNSGLPGRIRNSFAERTLGLSQIRRGSCNRVSPVSHSKEGLFSQSMGVHPSPRSLLAEHQQVTVVVHASVFVTVVFLEWLARYEKRLGQDRFVSRSSSRRHRWCPMQVHRGARDKALPGNVCECRLDQP